MLDRTTPAGFTGLTPAPGNWAIVSVQDRDSAYTDALVNMVPEPVSLSLLALGGLAALRKNRFTR